MDIMARRESLGGPGRSMCRLLVVCDATDGHMYMYMDVYVYAGG